MSDSLHLDIPNHAAWPTRSFGSICSLISRGTAPVYVDKSNVLAIGQRCVTSSGFSSHFARHHSDRATQNTIRAQCGDILLNSTGTGTIGRSVVFDSVGSYIVDGHVTVMRTMREVADSRWLNSVLRTSWGQRHLERFCYAGSTNQLELIRAPLRATQIPTPDVDEQRAISQVLDTLDTAVRETEAIIAKLKAVKQGLLHDLLTRGIDANGELRPQQSEAPHLYKPSPLGWIPIEWDVASLGDLSESLVDGPFGSNLKTAHYVESPGVRVVRLQNILAGEYDDLDRAFVSERHAASLARNRVTAGDVLIASLGDANNPVGRSCCYPEDLPDAINKADCFRFRAGPLCSNEFAMLSMNGAAARKQFRGYEQGVTMKRINLGNLRRVEIALPSIPEQQMITVRFRSTQKRIDTASHELIKLRFEKSALMDDLLTGRVRVTPLLETADV